MTHRSQPAPRYLGVGPITAASLMKSAVRRTGEARKKGQTAPSDQVNQPVDASRDQRGRRPVPRPTRR